MLLKQVGHCTMHRQANASHMKDKVQHTQATQGNRFTFCRSEGSAYKLAKLGLSPSALTARSLSNHRAPRAWLLAPGGEDRASGPRSPHLLARPRLLLDDHKDAASPPPALVPAPGASSPCPPQPAALLPQPGIGNAADRVSPQSLYI